MQKKKKRTLKEYRGYGLEPDPIELGICEKEFEKEERRTRKKEKRGYGTMEIY